MRQVGVQRSHLVLPDVILQTLQRGVLDFGVGGGRGEGKDALRDGELRKRQVHWFAHLGSLLSSNLLFPPGPFLF